MKQIKYDVARFRQLRNKMEVKYSFTSNRGGNFIKLDLDTAITEEDQDMWNDLLLRLFRYLQCGTQGQYELLPVGEKLTQEEENYIYENLQHVHTSGILF